MPKLNKSISPRMNNNNKNNRINVSIDIPIDSQDNRHTLPFTPANIVSKHKGQKKGIIVANVINQVPSRNEIHHVQVTIVM